MSDITVVVADSTPQNVVVSSSTPDITEVINVGPPGAGGGASYDQSLNTTDSPTFVAVNTSDGTLQGGIYPGFYADGHGFEMTHGDQNQGTIDVFAPPLSTGESVSVTLPSASGTLAIGNQNLNQSDAPTFAAVNINDGGDGYARFGSQGVNGNSDNGHAGHWGLSKNAVSFDAGDDGGPSTALVHGGITYNPDVSVSATPLEYSFPSSSGTFATEESVATNYAPLVGGLVPAANLPSYVDDVLEYATTGNFPTTGESGKIYVATVTGRIYRWTGSIYAEVSPSTAQVQSDWSASSGLGQILNKPTLFSGSYGDLTGTPSLFSGSYTDLTNRNHASTHATGGSDSLTAADIGAISNAGNAVFTAGWWSRGSFPTGSGGSGSGSAAYPLNTIGTWGVIKATGSTPRLYVNDNGTQKFLEFQTSAFATVATSGSYADLSSKPTLGTAAAKDIPASGNASSTQVVYGSDTRLTDTRTPSAHTHPLSDLTQSSATTGQVATWNGTAWAAATPANLTDASALTSGTLSDARLSSNVTLLTSTQTLTNKTLTTPNVGNGSTNAILTAYTANVLSVANSTTACGFSVFNTRDSGGTNYEAGIFDFTTNANSLTIGTVKSGTGTARRVRINSAEQIDFYCTDTSRMFQVSTSAVTSFNSFGFQWFSSASDPTTSSTPFSNGTSYCAVYKNTTSGVVSLWVRDGSTMKKVALA
jgi:hypothetical protein